MRAKASSKPIMRRGSTTSSMVNEADYSVKGCGSSNNYLQSIIDSLEDELMVIDRNFRIIEANAAVLSRHGKRREEVIGQFCYGISHGMSERCYPPYHECPIKAVWETGKLARATHIHIHYAGSEKIERYVDFIASPVADSQGNVTAVTELIRDVTETKDKDKALESKVAIAVENAKLHKEAQRKEEIRGELLQDVFSIQEEERKRIARELHDETSQVLASLTATLEAAAGALPDNIDKTRTMLRKAQALSVNILDDIHKLIYKLRPALLDDIGLLAAIRWLTDNNLEAAGITTSFRTTGQVRRLLPQVETTLFRVIQEAVNNIARHAQARNVNISLYFKKSTIKVRVRDNGRGFNVEEAMSSKDRPRGLGLLGMKERVVLMKGTLSIRSRLGGGTEIDIEIPLTHESSDE